MLPSGCAPAPPRLPASEHFAAGPDTRGDAGAPAQHDMRWEVKARHGGRQRRWKIGDDEYKALGGLAVSASLKNSEWGPLAFLLECAAEQATTPGEPR